MNKKNWLYYRKVATRISWLFVFKNIKKLNHQLDVLEFLSEKFNTLSLFNAWLEHPIFVHYDRVVSLVRDYDERRGLNYQILLKKIFGAM